MISRLVPEQEGLGLVRRRPRRRSRAPRRRGRHQHHQARRSYDAKILSQHYLRHREQPIHLANKSSLPRTVCIEVDVVNNATVRGADRLLYDQAEGKTLAVFDLAPALTPRTPARHGRGPDALDAPRIHPRELSGRARGPARAARGPHKRRCSKRRRSWFARAPRPKSANKRPSGCGRSIANPSGSRRPSRSSTAPTAPNHS